MSKYVILYNSKGGNGTGEVESHALDKLLEGNDLEYIDVTKVDYAADVLPRLLPGEKVVVSGGDGTLNRFVNNLDGKNLSNEIYYFAAGTGNDFLTSIGGEKGKLYPITKIIHSLPTVKVNGKTYKFINGIGFGIDGYCCEVGDQQREVSDKPVNYTSIAIKGLLFHFKPVNAKVTMDGVTKEYKKVWLAPTMFGGYYGGGMLPTPDQKREEGTVSTMVYYGVGKLRALMVFPSIFKGEHVKHTNMIEIRKGSVVTVEFDRPTALQIDGETIKGVTKYTVNAPEK